MKNKILSALFVAAVIFNAACAATEPAANSTAQTNNAVNSMAKTNTAANTTTSANPAKADREDEVPAAVKAVFADAQTITIQHKTLTDKQLRDAQEDMKDSAIETDHHAYLAFSTANGTRKQTGAATVVKAEDKDFIVIYENKAGEPVIKEIRAEGVPAAFLAQFAGKSHDDKLILGSDLKTNGADEKLAKSASDAIRVDVMMMVMLYGGHKH